MWSLFKHVEVFGGSAGCKEYLVVHDHTSVGHPQPLQPDVQVDYLFAEQQSYGWPLLCCQVLSLAVEVCILVKYGSFLPFGGVGGTVLGQQWSRTVSWAGRMVWNGIGASGTMVGSIGWGANPSPLHASNTPKPRTNPLGVETGRVE